MTTTNIRPRVKESILGALRAGVVPSQGIEFIQVGRAPEVKAMIKGIELLADGGAMFKLIVGDYGAGKTFFLHLVRQLAFKQRLVTIHADFSPERRLVSAGDQARNLYSELIGNMATRSRPDGGALASIIEIFIGDCRRESESSGTPVERVIEAKLSPLHELVAGWDFVRVLTTYCQAYESGNDHQKASAIRWLRGEYTTKTEARKDLDVRTTIDEAGIYDAIKLMSRFTVLAGNGGMLVILDEAVNLFKIAHKQSRTTNYEMILRILNDTLQSGTGSANLGVLIGITPEALFDPYRGLCSYDALASRLQSNRLAEKNGLIDYTQPALHLQNLSQEEMYLLLANIRNVFAAGDSSQYLVSDEGLVAFMQHCQKTIGDAYFRTPRETVRSFVQLLSLLEQYPDKSVEALLGGIVVATDAPADDGIGEEEADDTGLSTFTL